MSTKPCLTVGRQKVVDKWLSEFTEKVLPPQDVWCPTTPNETWVGLFHGRPAITGNSSAWGRALANLGYEVKRGIASREEMQKVSRGQTTVVSSDPERVRTLKDTLSSLDADAKNWIKEALAAQGIPKLDQASDDQLDQVEALMASMQGLEADRG